MRGTVHVTSARDHHWLRRLLRHRRAAWERQALSLGLTDALVERAAQVACDLLEASPQGVSRVELVEAADYAELAWRVEQLEAVLALIARVTPKPEALPESWSALQARARALLDAGDAATR